MPNIAHWGIFSVPQYGNDCTMIYIHIYSNLISFCWQISILTKINIMLKNLSSLPIFPFHFSSGWESMQAYYY